MRNKKWIRKSFDDSSEVLVADAETPENSQILRFAFLDFEYDPKKVLDDTQAFHSEGRHSTQLDWRSLTLTQGHQSQYKPLVVCWNHATVFDFVQKLVACLFSECLGRAYFVARVKSYYATSCRLCFQRKRIAWRYWRLIPLEVVCVNPHVGNVVQENVFALVFDLVQNACWHLAPCTHSSDSLYVPLFCNVDLFQFADGGDDNVHFSSSLRQVASLDDLHAQFIIKLVMLFKQGNQMLLNRINCTVIWVISDTFEPDVQWIFSKHSN